MMIRYQRSHIGNLHAIAKVYFQTMAVKSFYALFCLKTVISLKTVKFFDTFSLLVLKDNGSWQ